jgi:hypothetical protein
VIPAIYTYFSNSTVQSPDTMVKAVQTEQQVIADKALI